MAVSFLISISHSHSMDQFNPTSYGLVFRIMKPGTLGLQNPKSIPPTQKEDTMFHGWKQNSNKSTINFLIKNTQRGKETGFCFDAEIYSTRNINPSMSLVDIFRLYFLLQLLWMHIFVLQNGY